MGQQVSAHLPADPLCLGSLRAGRRTVRAVFRERVLPNGNYCGAGAIVKTVTPAGDGCAAKKATAARPCG
ncbi:hypothetical protein EVAR_14635_1 [Eumeta japonica]|uniref:Uncharacterized protein n=1 Tax=Eumeta variegata TaxID=151549 RepID=A0A4C1U3H9_EUMVA|nr:hypothetical protein EVAR_14635_1 [Eumeta japonica]